MSLINSTAIPSGVADDYEIGHSLRFDGSASNMSRGNLGTPTSLTTSTLSVWVKRSKLDATTRIYSVQGTGSCEGGLHFTSTNKLKVYMNDTGCTGDGGTFTTAAVYRDTSAWYHVVISINTTDSTANDRMKVYVNGERVTDFSASVNFGSGATVYWNSTAQAQQGRLGQQGGGGYLDGYLAEVNYVDGQALAPTAFGETGTYGEWKPIEYSGSYGNIGWYLNFATAADMGDDKSGNGHDWTESNIAATDQMLDTPTSNFCTWNPVSTRESYIGTLTQGNLRYNPYGATMDEPYGMKGTVAVNSGKWYFEVGRRDTGNDYHTCISGVVNGVKKAFALYSGNYYYSPEGNGSIGQASPGTDGQISGCAFDLENNKIWFAVNGTWTNSGNPSNNTGGFPLTAGLTEVSIFTEHPNGGYDGDDIMNCGQDSSFQGLKTSGSAAAADANGIGSFYYAPPTNFLSLNVKNLPDVAVIPSKHFNTVLYTGNNTAQRQITNVGFQPDWTWIKGRTGTHAANSHYLFDAVRGVGKQIKSNANNAEATNTNNLYAFDSDGFSLGQSAVDSVTNGASTTFVAWNWKAGNATLGTGDFTQGNIASTCSRNVDAGFSIVSYEGTGAVATVGHGLSSAPEFITVKNRESAKEWMTYTYTTSNTDRLLLNTTGATAADSGAWNNTSPSASLFTIGNGVQTNADNNDYIAYCFHSVEGYSKVGSYTGNTNADGAFVYTGFRPAYILIKNIDSAEPWVIQDTARSPFNPRDDVLFANTTDAEIDWASYPLDILSNGFKPRNTGSSTNSAHTFIYLAFAETPFKYSNAR